jgi:hypothetical protein
MNYVTKNIENIDYTFLVDTESKNPNFLTVVVCITENQETQFRKLWENSTILKEIAIDTAKSLNEKFNLQLNAIDSGTEWKGQFRIK